MSHALILVAVDSHARGQQDLEKAVAHEMAPFDENGQWFRDGSRWDWWVIGGRYDGRLGRKNVVQRKDLDPVKLLKERAKAAAHAWEEAQKQAPDIRELAYGPANISKDAYIQGRTVSPFFCGYFLRNRHWHENGRMGWFGVAAKSECQVRGRDKGKCLHTCDKTGAKVIDWNGDETEWNARYWDRFIEPLDPDTWLCVVDFHV